MRTEMYTLMTHPGIPCLVLTWRLLSSMLRLPILSPFVFVQNEGFEEFFDGMLKRNICYFDLFHELRGDELFDQPYVFQCFVFTFDRPCQRP